MDTKKKPILNSAQVAQATRTIRAYKHPFRYDIIGRLLVNGRMSSGEIASYLNLDEPYITEQLTVLHDSGLVTSEVSEEGVFFSANRPRLLHLRNSIQSFCSEEQAL
jgi:hypothetical protein